MKMRTALVACAASLLVACASGPNRGPAYTYNEIEVTNNSNETIRNMTLSVSGNVIKCGDIAALGICSERFGRKNYTQAPVVIDWAFGNKPRQTDEIDIVVPAYNAPGNPLNIAIEVSPEGTISVSLIQKTPS